MNKQLPEEQISLSADDAPGNFEKIADRCARASEAKKPFRLVLPEGRYPVWPNTCRKSN